MRDELAITLVKQTEALLGLLILASLGTNSSVPMVRYDVLYEREVDAVALQNLGITLPELILNITRAHLVEAKVLKDVPEEVFRDSMFGLFKVVCEALL